MSDQQLLKLLTDKKVADAYQYYEACEYKLYLAAVNCDALDKIIGSFSTAGKESVHALHHEALHTGKGSYKGVSETVDYCGIEIPFSTATTMLTTEAISLFHSFFDTFAQWMNLALFAEEAIPEKKASINSVINNLHKFPEYSGQFIDTMRNITSSEKNTIYSFISDFNNTIKHRSQIHIQNTVDMFTAETSVAVPYFDKDGTPHQKHEVIDVIHSGLSFCENLLSDSKHFIENYYSSSDNKYVKHRYYNPTQFLQYASVEDQKNLHPQENYAYIEVDPDNLYSEYDIMIKCDTTSQEDGRISLYNCPFPRILLRKSGSKKIIGILIPEDTEEYKPTDHHTLTYRKYISKTVKYQIEVAETIHAKDFLYYPALLDTYTITLNS